MNHISREGGCWVISSATAIQASDLPDDMPHKDHLYPDMNEWINAEMQLFINLLVVCMLVPT